MRHYIINGVVPIVIGSFADLKPAVGDAKFSKLSVIGGRGVLAGLYSTMDDALLASGRKKVHKLLKSALHFPRRMRLNRDRGQVALHHILRYTQQAVVTRMFPFGLQ